jgi:hypothetical protein
VDKAGYLTKSPGGVTSIDSNSVKRWARRWCELQGSILVYYANETKMGGEKGQIDLCDTIRLFLKQVGDPSSPLPSTPRTPTHHSQHSHTLTHTHTKGTPTITELHSE